MTNNKTVCQTNLKANSSAIYNSIQAMQNINMRFISLLEITPLKEILHSPFHFRLKTKQQYSQSRKLERKYGNQ